MKKLRSALIFFIVAVFTFFSVWYIMDSGLLKPFPKKAFLTFDEAESRAVYRGLSKKEKAVYTALYRGISERKHTIELPCDVKDSVYEKIYTFLQKQESGFFYLSADFLTADRVRTAKMTYIYKENEIEKMQKELEKVRDEALSRLDDYMSDYEKACCIHDFIAEKCTYSIETDTEGGSAYGCLVKGEARCEGYAKAFDYLLKSAGINDVVITGETDKGEAHAWNKFESRGVWYNVDVTWDDNDSKCEGRHIYFMSSKGGFNGSHYPEKQYRDKDFEFNKYEYNDTKKNYYFEKNNLFADNKDDIDEILIDEISSYNQKGFIEIQFGNSKLFEEFEEEYFENGKIWDVIQKNTPYFLSGTNYEYFGYVENEDENCAIIYAY